MKQTHSRWPAIFDLAQGLTGLVLVLFMWAHMFFVSSILLGKDAMYFVARLFEGEPIFGKPYPILVSLVAVFIAALIFIHAFFAMRKIPSSYRQYQALNRHVHVFKHGDTRLWVLQVITGFLLFFLIPAHIYEIMFNPSNIGPYESADRVWTGNFWPLYLVLLFVVELHAGVGIYRLIIKWGFFIGKDAKKSRRRLQLIKWMLTVFFIALGLLTLAAYMKIGYEHADRAGERYVPSYLQEQGASTNPNSNSSISNSDAMQTSSEAQP